MNTLPAPQDQSLTTQSDFPRPSREEIKKATMMILKNQGIARDVPEDMLGIFVETAYAIGANPILQEIHPVPRKKWDPATGSNRVVSVVAILSYWFYVARADRHPAYDGTEEAEFTGEVLLLPGKEITDRNGAKKTLPSTIDRVKSTLSCRVKVWRKDRRFPAVANITISEAAQDANELWIKCPRTMLEKCAKAQALRFAFPSEFKGTYIEEEYWGDEKSRRLDPLNEIPAPQQSTMLPASELATIQTKELLAEKCNAARVRLSDLLSANGLSADSLTEEVSQDLIAHLSIPLGPVPVDSAKEVPASSPVPQEQTDTQFSAPRVTDDPPSGEFVSELQRKILTLIDDMATYRIEKFDEPVRVEKSCMKHLNTKTVQECRAIPLLEKYHALLRGRVEKFAEGGK